MGNNNNHHAPIIGGNEVISSGNDQCFEGIALQLSRLNKRRTGANTGTGAGIPLQENEMTQHFNLDENEELIAPTTTTKSKSKLWTPRKAIEQIDNSLKILQSRRSHIGVRIENNAIIVKQLLAGYESNSSRGSDPSPLLDKAVLLPGQTKRTQILAKMKLSKALALQRNRIENMISNLEVLIIKLEQAADDIIALKALETGQNIMKTLLETTLNQDKVEELLDNIREDNSQMQDVSKLLEEPLHEMDDIHEEDILRELKELQEASLDISPFETAKQGRNKKVPTTTTTTTTILPQKPLLLESI